MAFLGCSDSEYIEENICSLKTFNFLMIFDLGKCLFLRRFDWSKYFNVKN